MAATPAADPDALVAEERRLAQAAAGGDGEAFATLYERYEQRAYNLAYRITGSEADAADVVQEAFLGVLRRLPSLEGRELAFGSYVFTATRNASYDLIEQRRRQQPTETISAAATPVGGGAGGLGLDPGDPDDDPDRRQLLRSQREEIRAANARLPERQREVLALRELEELSYDEIAAIMGMNRNSVAQLISRARLNLRAELRGAALGSIAGSSPECERALPLIARRDDGELDAADELAWLEAHLDACAGCRLGVEAMQEAGASYRAWAPLAAAPWLFEETMARAAEAVGGDWRELATRRSATRASAEDLPGMPSLYRAAANGAGTGRRRALVVVAVLIAALIVTGLAASRSGDATREPEPVVAEETAAPVPDQGSGTAKAKVESRPDQAASASAETSTEVVEAPGGGGPATAPSRAGDGREPGKQQAPAIRETRSDAGTKQAPAVASPPATQEPPAAEQPAVSEEPAPEPPPQREPGDPSPEPPPRPEPEKPIRTPPPPRTPPGSAPPVP